MVFWLACSTIYLSATQNCSVLASLGSWTNMLNRASLIMVLRCVGGGSCKSTRCGHHVQ